MTSSVASVSRHGDREQQANGDVSCSTSMKTRMRPAFRTPVDAVHLVDEPFDDAAGPVFGIELEREAAEVVEQVPAQIDDDAVRELDGVMAAPVAADRKQHCGHRRDYRQNEKVMKLR